MGMQTDVKSAAIAAGQVDAAAFAGPARVKGIVVSIPVAGGTLTIKDGVGGTTKFSFVAPAVAQTLNIVIPGEGIRCERSVNVTTAAGMTATVFYG
jgi:hypothetical protein